MYGIVQGIGFRPFVNRLAEELGLSGDVCNRGSCVEIHVEGSEASLLAFSERLPREAPEVARILRVEEQEEDVQGSSGFRILRSVPENGEVFVSPDLAICPDCERELFDPTDRRYLHPFINCTNCGPRLTILQAMPYDRERTSMAAFPMCPTCRREYERIGNRRYHAQPVCCPEDGPHFFIPGRPERDLEAISYVRRVIREGGIAAIRGIGGFHLSCDAGNEEAVLRLRTRKARPKKPFAVMARDLQTAADLAVFAPEEEHVLTGVEKPILLLKKRTERREEASFLADAVAPENPYVGLMLPYAPIHHLLFSLPDGEAFPSALVMTSGNRSGAPICRTTEEAIRDLGGICDVILTHDREILLRADDSVLFFMAKQPVMIRRSRGYAPLPFAVPGTSPDPLREEEEHSKERKDRTILAVGGELKNTFCIAKGDLFYPSPYIGDMEDLRSLKALKAGVERMEGLLAARCEMVAADLHPLYQTTRFANSLSLPVLYVQHHFAHVLSLMAEHMRREPLIGVAFDGTGYGTDGTIWGGEFLVASPDSFTRLGSLRSFPQPGGDAAAKEGWRVALSLLKEAYPEAGEEELLSLGVELGLGEEQALRTQLRLSSQKGFAVPSTSVGRLFDAVSAILGIRLRSTFEGEAATALQYAAELPEAPSFDLPVVSPEGENNEQETKSMILPGGDTGAPREFLLDPLPLVRSLVEARRKQTMSPGILAGSFHRSLADGITEGAKRCRALTGIKTVGLTGGVFQNALLLSLCKKSLAREGFEVLTHSMIPANDGGLSLGQAYYARGKSMP